MNDERFWKNELLRETARMRESIEKDGAERLAQHSVVVERFVFLTAYMMRKLREAIALSEEVMDSKLRVSEFACTEPPPHRTWFRVSEDGQTWRQPLEAHYDLDAPHSSTLPFERLCDRLIHHFAFEVRIRPVSGKLEILFNSDWTKDRLFGTLLDDYVSLVEEVAYDEIRWVSMDRGAKGGKGRVIQRRHRPPLE
jgi:hypothetical protein